MSDLTEVLVVLLHLVLPKAHHILPKISRFMFHEIFCHMLRLENLRFLESILIFFFRQMLENFFSLDFAP
jgi:hypothetical protein